MVNAAAAVAAGGGGWLAAAAAGGGGWRQELRASLGQFHAPAISFQALIYYAELLFLAQEKAEGGSPGGDGGRLRAAAEQRLGLSGPRTLSSMETEA